MKQYNVTGMSCAACSARVERAVSVLDGVTACSVNLLTGSMTVDGAADDEAVISAVKNAGYGASVKGKSSRENKENDKKSLQKAEEKGLITRLVISTILLIPLMYLSMGYAMWGWPLLPVLSGDPVAVALLELLISLAVMVINQRFFINGARGLVRLSPNMDTLVALGSGASFLFSTAVIFMMSADTVAGNTAGAHHRLHGLYFESAAMILVLITVGKFLEARAKGRTTDAIDGLISLAPKYATVVRGGAEAVIPADEVRVGDIFLVRPGEAVAVDGVVIEGESSVVEAALTGESIPADKAPGDRVLAATVNGSGFLRCEATRVGADTAISGVIKMVEDASAGKAPIAKLADRVSGIFVPVVMAVALIAFSIWWAVSGDVGYSLGRGISVLVISCPCALGLATPVAIMVGSGVGARRGILFKSAEALELSGRVKTVVLDKTGTVTKGQPEVTDVCPIGVGEEELVSLAAAIETPSEHPLARAITAYAGGRVTILPVSDFRALSGSGVSARLSGSEIYAGSYKFISSMIPPAAEVTELYERLSAEGKTPLCFARDGKIIGVIAVADRIREDSRAAIAAMKKIGLRVVMLTGDNERTAAAIGREAGVDEVIAGVLPDGKEEVVRRLSEEGRVAMVGDGINDAPALTRADVGMAIGHGADVAIDSADVVLMYDRLTDALDALRLGRATLRKIRQNLFWAFIYNAIGIPLAAGAFVPILGWELNPMFGAAAMSLSSFSVVTNALGLYAFRGTEHEAAEKRDTPPTLDCKNDNFLESEDTGMQKIKMQIEGMMCPHCEARVKETLEAFDFVKKADVSHKKGTATVSVTEDRPDALREAVEKAGYKVTSVN